MITKKERKLLILLLVLILVVTLVLSISIISKLVQLNENQKNKNSLPLQCNFAVVDKTVKKIQFKPEVDVISPKEQIKLVFEYAKATLFGKEFTEVEVAVNKIFEDRCRLTYAEARGECIEGQIAVTATILNRENSPEFPNTFYGVINEPWQFSPVWNGEVHVKKGDDYEVLAYEEISEQTIDAVQKALDGEDPTEQLLWDEAVRLGLDPVKYAEGGALFFYNPAGCDWQQLVARANIKVKVQIGNHIFYKVWDT